MIPVTRFIAGPGCGKTTRLLELVRHEAEVYGTKIGEITVTTFSRSMTAEVQTRIRTVFPAAHMKAIQSSVCTLNAAFLRACKAAGLIGADDGDRIITEDRKRTVGYFTEFAASHHLPYDPALSRHAPDEDRARGGMQGGLPGNVLFRLGRFIQEQSWDWVNAPHAEGAIGLHVPRSYGDTAELLQEWADFKAERQLYEHADYVRLATDEGVDPLAPVLFHDEAQDSSPLDILLLNQWRQPGAVDRMYMAGDGNQTIYQFRGADPILFEKLPGPVNDIGATGDGRAPQSYRCPSAIVGIADRVLGGRSNMLPRPGGPGRVWVERCTSPVGFVTLVEELHRQYGTVLVLSRYRRYVRKLSAVLTSAGLPHSTLLSDWSPPWNTAVTQSGVSVDMPLLLTALDTLADAEPAGLIGTMTPDHVWVLMAAAPRACNPPKLIRAAVARSEPVYIQKVFGWFTGTPPTRGMARSIAAQLDFRSDLSTGVQAALARGPARPAASSIVLSTIHGAKGRQAPAVVVHTGYNGGRAREYRESPQRRAEERRVYYVAFTRPSEALVILDGLRSGPSAPPLQEIPGVRP